MEADAKAPDGSFKEDVRDNAGRFSSDEEGVGPTVAPPRLASS